nr:DUF2855 family protein [Amycolatopsis rubida]
MNNVTYARLGDSALPFWNAFPAPEGYGRVPVWGFAHVEESRRPGIAAGRRYFGYLPMSSGFTLSAEPAGHGLLDTSGVRDFLHVWYRTYRNAPAEDELDDRRALLWPLFPASAVLNDYLRRTGAHGADTVVVTSASSKTAIGMAELLAGNGRFRTVGVTADKPFAAALNRYDEVVSYDELDALAGGGGSAVLVDFTGDAKRLAALYDVLAGRLVYTALVGYTHPDARLEPPELPGPEPEIFFTPAYEEETARAEGPAAYRRRYAAAEERFVRGSAEWLRMSAGTGPDAAAAVFRSLLAGEPGPSAGHVLRP